MCGNSYEMVYQWFATICFCLANDQNRKQDHKTAEQNWILCSRKVYGFSLFNFSELVSLCTQKWMHFHTVLEKVAGIISCHELTILLCTPHLYISRTIRKINWRIKRIYILRKKCIPNVWLPEHVTFDDIVRLRCKLHIILDFYSKYHCMRLAFGRRLPPNNKPTIWLSELNQESMAYLPDSFANFGPRRSTELGETITITMSRNDNMSICCCHSILFYFFFPIPFCRKTMDTCLCFVVAVAAARRRVGLVTAYAIRTYHIYNMQTKWMSLIRCAHAQWKSIVAVFLWANIYAITRSHLSLCRLAGPKLIGIINKACKMHTCHEWLWTTENTTTTTKYQVRLGLRPIFTNCYDFSACVSFVRRFVNRCGHIFIYG